MTQDRLPPGQAWTDEVIEYTNLGIPKIDIKTWRLKVLGLVNHPLELTYDELKAVGIVEIVDDLHCVEGWSVRAIRWEGVPLTRIVEIVQPTPSATHLMFKCSDGYSTVASLEDTKTHDFLLAVKMNGSVLTAEAGYPLRLVASGIYAWKFAKFLREIELTDHYEPGYWESRGYHPRGDVWKEERFGR